MSAPWTTTPAGTARYEAARAEAQKRANEDGCDRGIERNDGFKTFNVLRLPRRENRQGHELMCEVVSCEDLSKCQPGHGPQAVDFVRDTAPATSWPLKKAQHGYPPHDHPMNAYDSGDEIGSCGGPLVLPEQAGAKLENACRCGLKKAGHALGTECALGYTPAAGCLYCPKCKVFVVADDEQLSRARVAAKAEGFKVTLAIKATLIEPPTKKPRERLDPSKVTMDLFPGLPQYKPKLRPNGTAR